MKDDSDRGNPPIRWTNYLWSFSKYSRDPFAHPFFKTTEELIAVPRKWLIIYCSMTSSDMTSSFYRTLEMKGRDPNFMLTKFHHHDIISLGFTSHSFHPNFPEKKLKSEKYRSNPRAELMGVPLMVSTVKLLYIIFLDLVMHSIINADESS